MDILPFFVLVIVFLLIFWTLWRTNNSKRSKFVGAAAEKSDDNLLVTLASGECKSVPINDVLPVASKEIIQDAINRQLQSIGSIKYTKEIPILKVGLSVSSTTPLRVVNFVIDPTKSHLCGSILTIQGKIVFSAEGFTVNLFTEEKLSTTVFTANFVIVMLAAADPVYAVQFQSIVISNLSFSSLSTPNPSWTMALAAPSLTEYINGELVKVVAGSPNAIVLPAAPNTEYSPGSVWAPQTKQKMSDFLGAELSDYLSSPYVTGSSFKVCEECPLSTLSNIQLGRTVWIEQSACLGQQKIAYDCTGCPLNYRAGINSILGLDQFKLTEINFGKVEFPLPGTTTTPTNDVTVHFSATYTCPNVSLLVTAQTLVCGAQGQPPTYLGVENKQIAWPGTVTMSIHDAHIVGSYEVKTKIATFNSNMIRISDISLDFSTLPVDWAKVSLDSISQANMTEAKNYLQQFIAFITTTPQNIFQSLVGNVVHSAIEKQILSSFQVAVTKIPPTTLQLQV